MEYENFWPRFIAYVIDGLLFSLITFIFSTLLMFTDTSLAGISLIVFIIDFFVYAVYEVYMIHKHGQTLGKYLTGIKIVDYKGKKLTLKASFYRYLSKLVSFITLSIGHLMIIWTKKHQALHDKIMDTYAVKNKTKYKNQVILFFSIIFFAMVLYKIITMSFWFHIPVQYYMYGVDSEPFCDENKPLIRDHCYLTYSQMPITLYKKVALCSKVTSQSLRSQCFSSIAFHTKDTSYCDMGGYYKRVCIKNVN